MLRGQAAVCARGGSRAVAPTPHHPGRTYPMPRIFAIGLSLVLFSATTFADDKDKDKADSKVDPKQILEKANSATEAVKALSCDVEAATMSKDGAVTPRARCKAIVDTSQKADEKLRFRTEVQAVGSEAKDASP